MDDRIQGVVSAHALEIIHLAAAYDFTESTISELRSAFTEQFGQYSSMDVTLFGSLARWEAGAGSDCDYLILLDGLTDHRELNTVLTRTPDTVQTVGLQRPGQQGVFGTFSSTVELAGRIGLEADSNANTTRRLLLLIESNWGLNDQLWLAARRALLGRYCEELDRRGNGEFRVPRFLLNDLVRYWRTMTVDYGAKRWAATDQKWFLRRAKLLTSRKILFAGSVMALFSTAEGASQDTGKAQIMARLLAEFAESPLSRLLGAYDLVNDESKEALSDLVVAYDEFLGMLHDPAVRSHLEQIAESAIDSDAHVARVEAVGRRVEKALETIFFSEPFSPMSRSLLVF